MKTKISILGAGSGTFSLSLIRDFCLTPNLQSCELCFMDINEERLNASHDLCMRLTREMGVPLTLTKTTDLEEALTGASYVICTILIGGYYRLRDGWAIAAKYGYAKGGSMHIMHDEAFWVNFYQLRMMEDLIRNMERICPEAWCLMVSNPVLAGTTYLRRKYPHMKFVGLCHGTARLRKVTDTLGMDWDKVTSKIPGVNHFVWLNEFHYEGKDAFPILDKWLEENGEQFLKTNGSSELLSAKAIDLYHKYGVFPVGDTCTPGGGAWGFDYHTDEQTQKFWNEDPDGWYDRVFGSNEARVKTIEAAAYDRNQKASSLIDMQKSDEPMVPLIEALECGVERTVVVNVLNDREYVPGIPKDFEVEVPALCGSHGIYPVATKPLPKPILAFALRDRVAPVEMELAAYENHDKQLLIDLVMMDPRSSSRKQAEALVEEILDLPYHQEMKQWYR